MFIVNNRNVFFIISALLVAGSIVAMFVYGLNLGIDFKGGSVLEVSYQNTRPEQSLIKGALDGLDMGNYVLSPSGEKNYVLKTRDLTATEKTVVMSAFQQDPSNIATEERFSSLGPVVGNEMKNKALIAICIVLACILMFVTFAFRKVSLPVASWKYGVATLIALAHDVIIPTGVFVTWIHFRGGEIDLLFVSAILAILGYSVHDTIVVFDRVRENLKTDNNKKPFIEVVGESVKQTMGRSINTSLTTFLALAALYFIGGEATRNFAFILLVGIVVGTYSSVFVASPLLVALERWQKRA